MEWSAGGHTPCDVSGLGNKQELELGRVDITEVDSNEKEQLASNCIFSRNNLTKDPFFW